jgi:uncharacterized protein involved in type VI secretion and phage assembly
VVSYRIDVQEAKVSTFRLPSELIDRESRNKVYGVTVGIVTDNVHPNKMYMVKVRFPWLPNGGQSGGENSDWCRIATFGAGKDRGMYCLPEVNDEVLVAFEHGDIGRGVVIGSLWNGTDTAILDNKSQTLAGLHSGSQNEANNQKNDRRVFRSRVGHILEFNDNDSKSRVQLTTKQGHRLVLDDKGNEPNKIEIFDGKEENYILIDTKNKKITIETKTGDMLLKAKNTIRLESKTIEMKSDKDTKMQVGANFNAEASSNVTIKASSSMTLESGSTMTIKGSTVNIN